jgi:large subunit ribosomal protein L25
MRGGVPAEVYGLGAPNQSVVVDAHDLGLLLSKGSNTLINLKIDGGSEQLTLARQINRHPVKGTLTHVDFVRISADIAITAEVPLLLTGHSAGVEAGGLLEQLVFSLSISSKPGAIPTAIEYDISALGLGDQVRAGDLAAVAGVTLLHEDDELLAMISIPRALAAAQSAVEAAEAGDDAAADAGDAADDAGDTGGDSE